MQYFLALDAGGTKTTGAIADDRRELARAETGTTKLLRTGSEQADRNLKTLLTRLAADAGVSLASITRTCVGASGVSVPSVAEWIRKTLPSLAAGELLLCGDEEIALDAAFHGGAGIVVVAGTGSNSVGRASTGEMTRAGGWGPVMGDEGSGHWIGQEALQRAFRAKDEDRPGRLLENAMLHWQLPGLDALVEKANTTPSPDFSQLAPVVIAAAASGDDAALEILSRAGIELARLAVLIAGRLRRLGESSSMPIACAGSVLSPGGMVRTAMLAEIQRSAPELEVLSGLVDPIDGALWRARNGVLSS